MVVGLPCRATAVGAVGGQTWAAEALHSNLQAPDQGQAPDRDLTRGLDRGRGPAPCRTPDQDPDQDPDRDPDQAPDRAPDRALDQDPSQAQSHLTGGERTKQIQRYASFISAAQTTRGEHTRALATKRNEH